MKLYPWIKCICSNDLPLESSSFNEINVFVFSDRYNQILKNTISVWESFTVAPLITLMCIDLPVPFDLVFLFKFHQEINELTFFWIKSLKTSCTHKIKSNCYFLKKIAKCQTHKRLYKFENGISILIMLIWCILQIGEHIWGWMSLCDFYIKPPF